MRPARQLLAVSWEMPPLSGPRAVQVTRTLAALGERGWHSRVICFDARSQRYQQDYDIDVGAATGGMVTPLPVPSPEEWLFFRTLWRVLPPLKHLPDEKRIWAPAAIAEGRRALADRPADVIVSFAQPWSDHLIGLQLHRDTGIPWVAHFSDPWIDSPYQPGTAWTRARIARMERDVVSSASQLVFVNDDTRDRVMAKYPAEWSARAHVVPQGHTGYAAAAAAPSPGPLRIVYTGRFYDGIRTPDVFLQALADVHRASPLHSRLLVEFVGSRMDAYAEQARVLGVEEFATFTGRVSPDEASRRAAAADVLLLIDAPSDGPSLFLPSKLIDYLPFGKPILGITPENGPSADLMRSLGYPIVDPRDEAGMAASLTALLERHESGTLRPSERHAEVARAYDIRETTAAFDRVLTLAMGAV